MANVSGASRKTAVSGMKKFFLVAKSKNISIVSVVLANYGLLFMVNRFATLVQLWPFMID